MRNTGKNKDKFVVCVLIFDMGTEVFYTHIVQIGKK